VSVRRTWIEPAPAGDSSALPLSRQCELAGVPRSGVYRCWKADTPVSELDLKLLSLIDAEYTRRPFYGSRRMVVSLSDAGYQVNRKRVQRLMKVLGLAGMLPGPHTSTPHPTHRVYPYLLRGVAIISTRPGVERGYHVYPVGPRVCLSGGDHGLVLASGLGLAVVQYA
jgi:putative transposase